MRGEVEEALVIVPGLPDLSTASRSLTAVETNRAGVIHGSSQCREGER